MSTGFMDIDEFMNSFDNQSKDNSTLNQPNYEVLLQSVSGLNDVMDKANINKSNSVHQVIDEDLTADFFLNMSDSEMLSHFMPVRGIDYDQNYSSIDGALKKKDENKCDDSINIAGDNFLPHHMIPNPLCQASALKSIVQADKKSNGKKGTKEGTNKTSDKAPKQTVKVVKIRASQVTSDSNEHQQVPKPIKRRKPRTYKYNPKPLQYKECRSFVPDDLKDIDYWERRKRNNEAAKKSREERRKKELEIMNSYEMMKNEYSQIKIENIRLKARSSVLEKQVCDLKKQLRGNSSKV